MQLYYFEVGNSRKPCAVARYLELPVEFRRIDLAKGENKSPQFLAINPNGKVPTLVDGDVRMWESHAIMAHLARKAGSPLWPSDAAAQIEVMRWLLWDTAHFSRHAGRLFWEHFVKQAFGLGEASAAEVKDATSFFRQFAGVLDQHLADRTYVVGDQLTIADFGIGCFLPDAGVAKLPLDDFPHIQRWHDNLMHLPAWREPWPEARKAA